MADKHAEVVKQWKPEEIWLDLMEAFDSDKTASATEAARSFADKWLVRGQLLITRAQYDELQRVKAAQEMEDMLHGPDKDIFKIRPPRLNDVPVRVVTETVVTDLGGGLKAIANGRSIYVFKEIDLTEKMEMDPAPLSIVNDDRYPLL